jgi:membrane protein YdbS with pleckstrin-like domain
MVEHGLPSKTLLLWQIRFALFALLFLGVFTRVCYRFDWYVAGIMIIILIFTAIIFLYLPALIRTYRISYINGAVVIERGVFIKTTHIMPFSKMIYTQSITTPLAKVFGLSALVLKAARSSIFIPEIPVSAVEEFTRILAQGEGE